MRHKLEISLRNRENILIFLCHYVSPKIFATKQCVSFTSKWAGFVLWSKYVSMMHDITFYIRTAMIHYILAVQGNSNRKLIQVSMKFTFSVFFIDKIRSLAMKQR